MRKVTYKHIMATIVALVFIALVLWLASCKGLRLGQPLVLQDTIKISKVDTVMTFDTLLIADAETAAKFFECDSNLKVVAKKYAAVKDAYDSLPKAIRVKYVINTKYIDRIITKEVPKIVKEKDKEIKTPFWAYFVIFVLVVSLFGIIAKR